MAGSELVDDELWELVKPLLPDRMPQRTGRPGVGDRAALTAIVFVLVTGVPWRLVLRQIGCSGVTAWRRLREWQRAGVWLRCGSTSSASLSRERWAETAAGLRRSWWASSVVVVGMGERLLSTDARTLPRAASSAVPVGAADDVEVHRFATPRGPYARVGR